MDAWTSWTPCKHTKTGPQRRRFKDFVDLNDKERKRSSNDPYFRSSIDYFRRILPIASNISMGQGIFTERITDIIENEYIPELPRLFQVEQCIGEGKIGRSYCNIT